MMDGNQLGAGTLECWSARIAGALHRNKRCFSVPSPVTGHVIANVSSCGREQALLAVEGACMAAASWRQTESMKRASLIRRWSDLIAHSAERLSTSVTMETGKPLDEAQAEVAEAIAYTQRCAELARFTGTFTCSAELDGCQTFRRVRGVGTVLAVTNWCQPVLTTIRRSALALASGCQVIVKPSSRAPLSALMLADLWSESGGPLGTLQVLPTDDPITVVTACLQDPRIDMIAFTGSREVGQFLARQCAETGKALTMEVDGPNPIVVFPDADLKRAADAIIACTFLRNAGQDCTSANRLYVHERIAERLLGMLRVRVLALRVGDPREPGVQVGPLIDSVALAVMREQIEDAVEAGAQLVVGGRKQEGLRIVPAILDKVRLDMTVVTDVRPGPVLPTIRFNEREMVAMQTSAGTRGTTAWIWSSDLRGAGEFADELGYGRVWLNESGSPAKELTGLAHGLPGAWTQTPECSPYLKAIHHTFSLSRPLN